MADERKLMRISELVEATGVSAQTIHYYLREGLLPPPIKTAPNMAYYGPEYTEDIQLIKELQEKRYLPLSVIKLVLEARREQGKNASEIEDMRLGLEELFRPLGPEDEVEPVALVELVAMTGLAAATLGALEEIGLLMPAATPRGKRYDGLDVRVAREVKKLLGWGLEPSDLAFYGQYIEALRTEARVMREKVIYAPGGGCQATGSELKETLDNLKAFLTAKIYRWAALDLSRERGTGVEQSDRP